MFKKSLIASVSALMLIPSVSVGAMSAKAYTDEGNEDIRVQKMNEENNIILVIKTLTNSTKLYLFREIMQIDIARIQT